MEKCVSGSWFFWSWTFSLVVFNTDIVVFSTDVPNYQRTVVFCVNSVAELYFASVLHLRKQVLSRAYTDFSPICSELIKVSMGSPVCALVFRRRKLRSSASPLSKRWMNCEAVSSHRVYIIHAEDVWQGWKLNGWKTWTIHCSLLFL